jgi:uncharacterized protein (UPF0276 family)
VLEGAGIGWRPEIAADLLRAPGVASFVEVTAEACVSAAARREAAAVSEIWPVALHGVKLSLGSAEGIDVSRARKLAALAKDTKARVVSEHVAFVRGGGREIGHLTQLPFTREAARVVARNVTALRREMPDLPFLLENVAWTLRWPDDELDEGAFYAEVVRRTGCDLLLDVGNLYANAVNSGREPLDVLQSFPLDHVAMLHVAGGVLEDGFFLDTHAHRISPSVLELVQRTLERVGRVPVLLERDASFGLFQEIAGELQALQALLDATPARRPGSPGSPADGDTAWQATDALAGQQAVLARMLTDARSQETSPFDAQGIARTRRVLQGKRVDDALPLLPRLGRREEVRVLAHVALEAAPRPESMVAVADAFRIAERAAGEPELVADARADRLALRARFVRGRPGGAIRPRVAPFVGFERDHRGRSFWALKGLGREAEIRMTGRR